MAEDVVLASPIRTCAKALRTDQNFSLTTTLHIADSKNILRELLYRGLLKKVPNGPFNMIPRYYIVEPPLKYSKKSAFYHEITF